MEPRLARWVTASLATLLQPVVVDELGMVFFVEAVEREKPEWFQKDSAVLRVVGPTPRFGSSVSTYKFEVMVMLTDLVTDSANGYEIMNRAGTIANVLSGPIPVYQYPDGATQAGCLDIDNQARDFLRVVPFGKLDKDTEVVQTAVIASYVICLDN